MSVQLRRGRRLPIFHDGDHTMLPLDGTRRSFLHHSVALAGAASLVDGTVQAQKKSSQPLLAYVGTFSSPLRDVLPTQVDLPPGNGRGIHIFQVNRTSGKLTPTGIFELGTSPSCLAVNAAGNRLYSANETDRVGDDKHGTVSAFAINRADGKLELLNTVGSGGAGPTYVSIHPSGRFLLVANYFGGSLAELGHVSTTRTSHIMNLLHLAPDIQERLLFLKPVLRGPDPVFLKDLQSIARLVNWSRQRTLANRRLRLRPRTM